MDEPRVEHDGVVGPIDAVQVPRYAGFSTFARLPRIDDVERFDCAVVGIPFDSGVTYRPGARFGPSYVRQGSRLLRPYNPVQDVEPFRGRQVVDAGDISVNPFSIDEAIEQIQSGIGSLASIDRRLLAIGGDHTIALPILRVMHDIHGPLSLVHFDAHLDTWDTYFGAPYTHGTPFRRAWEEQLLLPDQAMHIGIRGPLYSAQDIADDESFGFSIVHCHELESIGVAEVVRRMRDRVGNAPVYVSIDIDVLDPAHAPGTGTPEAGGLTSRELLAILRGFEGTNVVGADIVEVAPPFDHAEITSIAAAHVGYELLSVFARQ